MNIKGILISETPIYRGNSRKTLFTRDDDGTQRLVSLAGEIEGTASSLMDAFIGSSSNGKNIGLLNRLWSRLYGASLPDGLIRSVSCALNKDCYPKDRFFDLRMGIKLDEDRWAAEANANYKMETLFRGSRFNFEMMVDDGLLAKNNNASRLFHLLKELEDGRFWFGAGKSKGLGRCRLQLSQPMPAPKSAPAAAPGANHMQLDLCLDAENPLLISWNWGKADEVTTSFIQTDGRVILQAIRNMPDPIKKRLEGVLGGPVAKKDEWKRKLFESLPRAVAGWLRQEAESCRGVSWVFPGAAVTRLGKGKNPMSAKIVAAIQERLADRPFANREAAEAAFQDALGKEAKKSRRALEVLTEQESSAGSLPATTLAEIQTFLSLDDETRDRLLAALNDLDTLTTFLGGRCQDVFKIISLQVDTFYKMLESDPWVDGEIKNRREHLRIKELLAQGRIKEQDWGDRAATPDGVSDAGWVEFINSHAKVSYRNMLNRKNLIKSINNDENFIAFLDSYRQRTRRELAQPAHIDFRAGGKNNREISRIHGKPYDNIFMRMLVWSPSHKEEGKWEVYIPGATIKGAFRKRASMILKTLWGEGQEVNRCLDWMFGTVGRPARVLFSDAYLNDPDDPQKRFCSMDGVRMDPSNGKPVEEAKCDSLFAYGKNFTFRFQAYLQDLTEADQEYLGVLNLLLRDFTEGELSFGGSATNGFGWAKGKLNSLVLRTTTWEKWMAKAFGEGERDRDGLWERLTMTGEAVMGQCRALPGMKKSRKDALAAPPKAGQGFISHRSFGGLCGMLHIEGEVLTPLLIKESGEPSFMPSCGTEIVNGWDFFSLTAPDAESRGDNRRFAVPSKTIKGLIRHLYSITANATAESRELSALNPVDSLFGWVGQGPNKAIRGRLAFSFGLFESPSMAWFQIPHFYGRWQYNGKQWLNVEGSKTQLHKVSGRWRLFPHLPLAPCIKESATLNPEDPTAAYQRGVLPGNRFQGTIRFWNLDVEEFSRLLWTVALEKDLAHKIGQGRALGLGSVRLRILPESYITDWTERYSGTDTKAGRRPLNISEWLNIKHIANHKELLPLLRATLL